MAGRENCNESLKQTQKGNLDITNRLQWFLKSVDDSIYRSEKMLGHTMAKAKFWSHFAQVDYNERQKKVLNCLLDVGPRGFEGGLK